MGELYNTFGMLKPEVFRDEGFVGNSRIGASQASSKRGTWKISQELSQLKTCWTEKTLIFHKVKYVRALFLVLKKSPIQISRQLIPDFPFFSVQVELPR
jgi:hypothetical protein